MTFDRRLALAMLAPGVALGLWLALGGALLRATLDPGQRAAVDAALGPLAASHGMLAVAWWLVAAALAAWVVRRLYGAHVAAPARLADATRVLAADAAAPDLVASGDASLRALTEAINALAGKRRSLQAEMARLVAEASRDVAQQRDQLGALMAELNQSVVVCNLDGRILLYNERARRLFRRLSPSAGGGGGRGTDRSRALDPCRHRPGADRARARDGRGAQHPRRAKGPVPRGGSSPARPPDIS